jgi:glycosyltransferase involved in cell wall biosynthesis
MRVALVHDWLTGMRGGEKCLDALCRLWPQAHLYTLVHARGRLSPAIERMDIRTSFLDRVPGIHAAYRFFLPAMPAAIESFRLDGYDLVVSLSHCVAKSARVPSGVPHVCYCFTPMRYAWHLRDAYIGGRAMLDPRSAVLGLMRRWDRATARRVTRFVAISQTVARRIRECYGRSSTVIYPPVDTDFYTPAPGPRGDYYLCVAACVPYKRTDLAIEACNRLGRRLVIVGSGPDELRLKSLAGPTVHFAGWQPDEVLRDHYRRCRALLFPGIEDFGIVPLEAQACGAPVIALSNGGTTETVIPPTAQRPGTGMLFEKQSAAGLVRAMQEFEADCGAVCGQRARANAERFCKPRFIAEMTAYAREAACAEPRQLAAA